MPDRRNVVPEEDPRQRRLRDLEDALADIAAEARAGRHALCAHELQMRLENIARRLENIARRLEDLALPPA